MRINRNNFLAMRYAKNEDHVKCVACGKILKQTEEIAFRREKQWRLCVAKHLNYDAEFIVNFSKNSRICRHHFLPEHLVDNTPIKIPTLFLNRVENWPLWVP